MAVCINGVLIAYESNRLNTPTYAEATQEGLRVAITEEERPSVNSIWFTRGASAYGGAEAHTYRIGARYVRDRKSDRIDRDGSAPSSGSEDGSHRVPDTPVVGGT